MNWCVHLLWFFFFFNKFPLTDDEMMMESEQVAPTGQGTENLTELGKCLLKHEVSVTE